MSFLQWCKDFRCFFELHFPDDTQIGSSFNGILDYYCANCQRRIYSRHIEDNKETRKAYEDLMTYLNEEKK